MMTREPLIEEIYVKGLKCIEDISKPIKLDEKLTVLYGPNSTGKSTILQGAMLLLYLI
ncbi:MAG: AAA family ATPase, partial [Crenarchaeota archaeon]|nr:AAA family ATPase [Thermoproteota archaeon]